jgi:hypothetical protein
VRVELGRSVSLSAGSGGSWGAGNSSAPSIAHAKRCARSCGPPAGASPEGIERGRSSACGRIRTTERTRSTPMAPIC